MTQPDANENERLMRQVQAGDANALEGLVAQHLAYLLELVDPRMDPKLRSRVDPSDVVLRRFFAEARTTLKENAR